MGCFFSSSKCCCFRGSEERRFTDLSAYVANENEPVYHTKVYSWDLDRPPACIVEKIEDAECIRESNGQQVIIRNCRNSKIYVVDWTTSAIIDDCQDCVIVLSVVGGSLFLRDTTNSTLVSASTQLRLRDCSNVNLFTACESDPIIENSSKVVTAPYFLTYSSIEDHFKSARLDNFVATHWGNIYDFSPSDPSNFTRLREPYDVKRFVPIPEALVESLQVSMGVRNFVPITQDVYREHGVSLVLFPEGRRSEALDFVQNCKIAASSLLLTAVKIKDVAGGDDGKVIALLFAVPVDALPVTDIQDVEVTEDLRRIRYYFVNTIR